MAALTYRPELDGLRAVAVYLVLLFHAGLATFAGGFVGVDLFFVLSGFLVTHVILREVDERGTFGLGGFYARRVRRLLPAAVVVIVCTALLQLLVTSLPARVAMVDDARSALLYYANWSFIHEARDYFASDVDSSPFIHFWSLSIEEQFYILFPLLLVLAVRISWRPERVMTLLVGAAFVVSLALQVWRAQDDVNYAYYATETRLYQLAAGALLALAVRSRARRRERRAVPRTSRLERLAAPAGLAALVVVGSGLLDVSASTRGILAALASVVTIAGLWWVPQSRTGRGLALPIPRYLGQVSYGTYLWHWPVLVLLRQVFDVRPFVLAVLGAAVATGLAALSYQVLETPIRRTPRLHGRRWVVVGSALTASALVAALVIPQVLEVDRKPAVALAGAGSSNTQAVAAAVGGLDGPVPHDVDLLAAQQDIAPQPPVCTASDPDACTLVHGDSGHVVLVGDSHAEMFLPAFEALAREHDLTLSASIVIACAWQAGLQNDLSRPDLQSRCREARQEFYEDVLPGMDADLVVAVSMSRSDKRWETDLSAPGGPPGETLVQRQQRTAQETAQLVRDAGADLVLVKSVMGTEGFDLKGFDPIDCLSSAARLSDCAVIPPLTRPAYDGVLDVLAASEPGVAAIDVNPILCANPPLCAPIVDGTVVWKDNDHVTTEYLVQHRRKIWDRLVGTGLVEDS